MYETKGKTVNNICFACYCIASQQQQPICVKCFCSFSPTSKSMKCDNNHASCYLLGSRSINRSFSASKETIKSKKNILALYLIRQVFENKNNGVVMHFRRQKSLSKAFKRHYLRWIRTCWISQNNKWQMRDIEISWFDCRQNVDIESWITLALQYL
jgi:hypothetical protein